jgi:methanogenic corrinoid protein MtbC1
MDAARPPSRAPHDLKKDISQLLEGLVIPRLLAGSKAAKTGMADISDPSPDRQRASITFDNIDQLTRISANEDAAAMLAFVEQFLGNGHSVESIYVELLAPAARRLGEHWETDRTDFVTVTMALWRIQEVLRELAIKVPPATRGRPHHRTILLSAMPGDQHSLGTLMVAECFERDGWQADVLIEPKRSELTGKVASQSYDMVGLTVSCDCSSAALAALITTIRTVSRNPEVKVLIGGPVVNAQPDLVGRCGADGTAKDAAVAVEFANKLVPVMREYAR